ncbi:MAG TPA: heavy metal translocating P-type ATPase [Thermomicrobiales bacterium]|nr:heavy metal translocating P-type ATPase [Thermomicrobiales bacterium]
MAAPLARNITTVGPLSSQFNNAGRSLQQFLAHWKLALAASGAWALTFAAVALDHLTTAQAPVIVALYVLAYLAGGLIAARAAISDLVDRTVNVDLLMVLAAIGAATLDAWAEGAILLALFATSNALEHHALDRTRNAVRALMELSPDEATVLDDAGERIVPTTDLKIGMTILVRPGEKIAADAEVVSGASWVDQSAITGESVPVARAAGDTVFAGSVNGSGALRARVSRLSSESTLARIVRLVEEAQSRKSRSERFTDAFEGPYAIGVIATAFLVALVPIALGADRSDAFYRAMTLLVVASPCALVISTPAATLSAIANAARHGILVKGGSYLDGIGATTTVAFDKTGTLTYGRPALTDLRTTAGMAENDLLRRVASVEHLSEHPIASAIVAEASARGLSLLPVDQFRARPGMGVTAVVDGEPIAVGNIALFRDLGIVVPADIAATLQELQRRGRTAMLIGSDRHILGVAGVADVVRPEAAAVVAALKRLGVRRTVMLTGDNDLVARAIARETGIDDVYSDLLPEDKLDVIRALQRDGPVLMVGDGVNDAPALAAADLGVAMGVGGTDVALETADIVLMGDDLGKLPFAVGLSRKMRGIIRVNIGISLAVITVLVLSTLSVGIPLPLGVIGHEGSTIIVVLNGLRLLAYGRDREPGLLLGRARASEPVADGRPLAVS